MSDVVLDTNVASLEWKDRSPRKPFRHLNRYTPVLTFVTVGELTEWMVARRWGPRKQAEMLAYFDRVEILRYNREVADTWGALAAKTKRRGRPISENDIWIAATCIVHQIPLATFNTKDFQDFADRDGLVLMP